jgi:hypothetical protein
MRRTTPFAAAVLIASVCGNARADTFDYPSLPTIEITRVPKKSARPQSIARTERIAGMFLTQPPESYRDNGLSQLYLFSSEEQADQMFGRNPRINRMLRGRFTSAPAPQDGCFATHEYHNGYEEAPAWRMQLNSHSTVHRMRPGADRKQHGDYYAGVSAVRFERLTMSADGTATVTAVDGWVDALTGGARAVKTTTLRFKPVAKGPGGVQVFAARSPVDEQIHFLIKRRPLPGQPFSQHWTLQAGHENGSANCGMARVSLEAGPGMGDSGFVRLEVPLSVTDIDVSDSAGGKPLLKELRTRHLRVNLSLSHTASDGAPVPSVAFAWDGNEERRQTFADQQFDLSGLEDG